MIIGWSIFFVGLFVYRCGLSVFAQLAITDLGDAGIYQGGGRGDKADLLDLVQTEGTLEVSGVRVFGTMLTEYVGAALKAATAGNPFLINIGFQAIAFVGICRLLMAVEPRIRKRLALLVLLPTFNLWSSVASKEALVTFLFCLILVRFVEIERTQRAVLRLSTILLVVLLGLFKPHYAAAVCFLFGVTFVCLHVRQSATVALACGVISLVPLWLASERIDDLARTVAGHFRVGETTLTREMYFTDRYDVFYKAPYGMFQSFFGPTLSESMIGPLQLASFVESAILIAVLAFLVVRRLAALRVREVVIGGFTLFWMLFPSYPFGIMNPGSAVRYRAGYLVFVLFVIVFVMLGNLYARDARRREPSEPMATAAPSAV